MVQKHITHYIWISSQFCKTTACSLLVTAFFVTLSFSNGHYCFNSLNHLEVYVDGHSSDLKAFYVIGKVRMLLVSSEQAREPGQCPLTMKVKCWSSTEHAELRVPRSPCHLKDSVAAKSDVMIKCLHCSTIWLQGVKEVFNLPVFDFNVFSNIRSRKNNLLKGTRSKKLCCNS